MLFDLGLQHFPYVSHTVSTILHGLQVSQVEYEPNERDGKDNDGHFPTRSTTNHIPSRFFFPEGPLGGDFVAAEGIVGSRYTVGRLIRGGHD